MQFLCPENRNGKIEEKTRHICILWNPLNTYQKSLDSLLVTNRRWRMSKFGNFECLKFPPQKILGLALNIVHPNISAKFS